MTTTAMSLHVIIAFIITVLSTFIQVEFQSKSLSLLDTHSLIIRTFFVVLLSYALSWARTLSAIEVPAQNDPNDIKMIMSKISPFLGALASVLLLIIVFRVLGWVSLALWAVCFLKTAFELVKFLLFQVLDKLSTAIHGHADQRNEDRLPV